jgi:two-component system chemotaxis sensor kinase CheA
MEQLRAAADNGPQARKLLDTLFRSVHNLKATASANGLTSLAQAAHEFEDVLHTLRKHAVQQSLAEGARMFLVQTVLDVSDFDRQFQSLKERLSKTGEVISTEPSVNKERPEKVNFRILYAASQIPAELPPSITIEEISGDIPTATHTFEQQMPVLERAFQKFAAELKTISVDDVLAQAVRAGEAAAQATGKEVEFEIKGDAALLNQLPSEDIAPSLLHLVRNAVDHGIETRGKVTIEIARRDDHIAITVTDNGRGIDPELLEQIFRPGFSTAGKVSEISGRGVGLDVVKTSIEELGGTVTVRSSPGQVTSFELTLPIRAA